ncbi:tail [Aeromonas phage vB_AspA_Tola]|nr:tail [Aeromonas phage vB_AspA_Tola]
MSRVTSSWGRPIQGVSQQPDRVRMEGQCTLQENFIPDLVKGLTRRPSTYFVKKILDSQVDVKTKWHSYDRGDESYFMYVAPNTNTVTVFNTLGELQSVTGTTGYISTDNPAIDLDFKTIGDFTFITNKNKPVLMSSELSPVPPNTGIVYCQFATYGKTYKVIIDGITVSSYTTPDGSDPSHINSVATDYVAEQLYNQIAGINISEQTETLSTASMLGSVGVNTSQDIVSIISVKKAGVPITFAQYDINTILTPSEVPGTSVVVNYIGMTNTGGTYVAELHGNVIVISKPDNSDFKLTTSDSQNGEDLIAAKDSVKSINQLPPYAPDGYILRITGEGKSTKDDYWLRAEQSNETNIRWVETVEPGIPISFDATTMPHSLVRESITAGIATFSLGVTPWENRQVGGEDSNPLPSFINTDNPTPIKATGVFQNRLFFLSAEAWIASRSNLFFNFWRETTQARSDSDPLDGFADTDKVNNLHKYQILNGDLALFAESAQFLIKGDKPATADNLTLIPVTTYPNNIDVQPQSTGENVFFAFDATGYTGVREMFTDNFLDTKRATPITDYVSKYLVGTCTQMLASPNFNTMLIRTNSDMSVVYVYDWLWQADQKVQSAWHKWIFDGSVDYIFYLDDLLYIVYKVGGKTYLDYLYMVNDPDSSGLDYSICLDHKVTVDATFNTLDGSYSYSTPYDFSNTYQTISDGGWPEDIGSSFSADKVSPNNYKTEESLSNEVNLKVVVGVPYESKYIPTQPTVRDQRDRVIGLDAIIMSNLYIHYEETGFLGLTVVDKFTQTRDYNFYGRWMGTSTNLIGSPVLEGGTYRAPIRQRAEDLSIQIHTSSHYPLTIRDMEFDGTFQQRGARI